MQFIRERRRLVLLVLVVLVLLCLVGAFFINQFYSGGDGVAADTPTPAATPTEEGPVVIVTPEDEATATPTRVIDEEPAEEPTAEATEVASEPTEEPTPVLATSTPTDADFVPAPPDTESVPAVLQTGDILKNGGFEEGFDDLGVGADWQYFKTDGAVISFSGETIENLIQAGSKAQRISVDQAFQADRYAGIYQTLEVVPDETYTFTIYGQTRTFFGDVEQSSYGYRVQYAVDFAGGDDWQQIPVEDWVELPWGEEAIDASEPTLSEYSVEITPTSNQMTLFVRVWNKWPDPGLVEYTLDSLSVVGPIPGTAVASTTASTTSSSDSSTTTSTEQEMIDQPLPVTGTQGISNFMGDARFWGGILVLVLLAVGAVYRAGWRW